MTIRPVPIIVVGAGVLGLWQALTLARAGHRVTLHEASAAPFDASASRYAGAMLAPDCEAEAAPDLVRDLGRRGLELWRAVYPGLVNAGSLVVAAPRDRADFTRFARMTSGYAELDQARLAALEPDLAGRFAAALYYANEAHMATPAALQFLLAAVREVGVEIHLQSSFEGAAPTLRDTVIVDCRGMAAREALPGLRGVRGERIVVRTRDVTLARPVRLLHPRHPLYVVPWGDGRFVVGATVIESEDQGPATVRSALDLLSAAYALHPAFAEAEIVDIGAGIRPAFADNVPRVVVADGGRRLLVNGAYRHGFLLAPVLAEAVAGYVSRGVDHPLVGATTPS